MGQLPHNERDSCQNTTQVAHLVGLWPLRQNLGTRCSVSVTFNSARSPQAHVSVIAFAFLVIANSNSPGLCVVPAWLVTPAMVISPPDVANGFVLFTIRVTEFVDGSYDGVKLTAFRVVTGFFFTRFVTVEYTSNVALEISTGMLNWNRKPSNTGLPTFLPFFSFWVLAIWSPSSIGAGEPEPPDDGALTVIGLVLPALSPPDVASMLPIGPAVAIESPPNVATPFLAWTVVVKEGSPGSAIVTSPLKPVSTLPYGSSADTTMVKS